MDRFPLRVTTVFVGDIVKFIESETFLLWRTIPWYNDGLVIEIHKNRKKCRIEYTDENGKSVRVWRKTKYCWVKVPREKLIRGFKYEFDPLSVALPPELDV